MATRRRHQTDLAIENCPVFIASRILGKKWAIIILQELMMPEASDGLRFNVIHKHLEWITPKVLSQRLKELVSEGIVHREMDSSTIPPKVTYRLTEKGWALKDILLLMQAWGKKYGGDKAALCHGEDFSYCKICRQYP